MTGLKSAFAKAWGHPHRDRYLWGALYVGCTAYFFLRYIRHPAGAVLYRDAAQCLWDQKVLQVCDWIFTYNPTFAFIMLPSIAIPMWLMLAVWFAITVACAIWCCRLCERLVVTTFQGEWSDRDRELLRLFGILISLKFILAVFENQGFDLLVLPAVLIGILALAQGRDVLSGVSLAAATALKVTPLLFLPYLIFKRRFVAAAVFAAALILFCFLPDMFFHPQGGVHGYFLAWVHDVAIAGLTENPAAAPHPFWNGANPLNLSLRGALALALDGTSYASDFKTWLRVLQLAFVAVIGAMLLASRKKDLIAIDGAILIIAILMLSPMSSRDHFVSLILPYYLIVAGVMRAQRAAFIGVAILVLSFWFTGIPREIVPHAYSEFVKMHSDSVYATLLLLVYLGMMIRSPKSWGISQAAPAQIVQQIPEREPLHATTSS
ncbi:MAG: glycosyltransferase family 87 protein [Bradyrhizobium sp.]